MAKASHVGMISPAAAPTNPVHHVPLTVHYQHKSIEGNELMKQGGAQIEARFPGSNDFVVIGKIPFTQTVFDLSGPLTATGVYVVQYRQIGHCGDLSDPSPAIEVTIDRSIPLAPIAPMVSSGCGC